MEKKIISIKELSRDEIISIVKTALEIKSNPQAYTNVLAGKTLLLLFQKTSTRTRVAFELGMKKLGGDVMVMDWSRSNFSISPVRYEAAYVSRMVDCILARVVKNRDMVELAEASSVPVINGCCNMFHPTQILGDLLTIYEIKGNFDTSITYTGVQNNVANSLFYACSKLGIKLTFVTPLKDEAPEDFEEMAENTPGFSFTLNLKEAVSKVEFVYTDTWINMELFYDKKYQPEKLARIEKMLPYQVNRKLVEGRDFYIMHDMPVHPGMEIDDYSILCERSIIFQQAENRMYSAQALLLHLLCEEIPRL